MNSSIDHLRSTNNRLEAGIQELKLEIAFHKSEIQRLELEKGALHQDIKRMSSLFKSWIDELQSCSNRTVAQDPKVFNLMAQNPCKSVSDVLQMKNDIVFLTSCQPPHYIEYANKKWTEVCGWSGSEVLGLTCGFLQGPMTNKKITEDFMKSIEGSGYGNMQVYNYKKNGDIFEVTITVYPVFDSVCSIGPEADIAVLTHYASVMKDVHVLPSSSSPVASSSSSGGNSSLSSSMERSGQDEHSCHSSNSNLTDSSHNSFRAENAADDKQAVDDDDNNNRSDRNVNNSDEFFIEIIPSDSNRAPSTLTLTTNVNSSRMISERSNEDEKDHSPTAQSESNENSERNCSGEQNSNQEEDSSEDRRFQSKKFEAKYILSQYSFYHFGNTLRLSNLLRLMLSCRSAMILSDAQGRIIHTNKSWSILTGYEQHEVEGKTCKVLQGEETEKEEISRCHQALYPHIPMPSTAHESRYNSANSISRSICTGTTNDTTSSSGSIQSQSIPLNIEHRFQMIITNYKKSGEKFLNHVIIVPIYGGYLNNGITHYCAYCKELPYNSTRKEDFQQILNQVVTSPTEFPSFPFSESTNNESEMLGKDMTTLDNKVLISPLPTDPVFIAKDLSLDSIKEDTKFSNEEWSEKDGSSNGSKHHNNRENADEDECPVVKKSRHH